jgi:CBS domain-containing protein
MEEPVSSRISPSHSLVQNLRQQVMQSLPFSKMATADVDYFLNQSREAYYAPKEVILSPADGPPSFLYLIRQGRVSGRRDIPGIEETAFHWMRAVYFLLDRRLQIGLSPLSIVP